MLSEFQGALVFVSHDREFLDGLCNQILEVGDGAVQRYEGNYSAWRNAKAAEAAARGVEKEAAQDAAKAAARARAAKSPPKPAASPPNPSPSRSQSSTDKHDDSARKSGSGKIRNPYLFEKLEKRIMTLEEELKTLQESCVSEAVYRVPEKLRDTQMRIAEIERDLAEANQQWENWIS
jgi:ATPase subunit of ABC transporter with duplicated ATPase domains